MGILGVRCGDVVRVDCRKFEMICLFKKKLKNW